MLDDFKKHKLPKKLEKPVKFVFATSFAAQNAISVIADKLNKIKNLECKVCPVKSEYWGRDITVAGLITSDDLIRTVKDIEADFVVIPSVILRPYSEDFLDGKNLDYVKKMTNKDFFVIKNSYSVSELIDFLVSFQVAV